MKVLEAAGLLRVEETLSARTGSELRATLRELPALEAERRPRSRPTPHPLGWLAVLAIAVALVWLAVTHVAVWPLIIVAVLCCGCPVVGAVMGRPRHRR